VPFRGRRSYPAEGLGTQCIRPSKDRSALMIFDPLHYWIDQDHARNTESRSAAAEDPQGNVQCANIPTTKWFCYAVLCAGTPNHFESSIYSRGKVGQSPSHFGSGIVEMTAVVLRVDDQYSRIYKSRSGPACARTGFGARRRIDLHWSLESRRPSLV
jgi:hypothetical protein